MRRPRQRSSFGPRLATIRARRVCTLVLHGRNPPADQREVRAANRTNERPAADLAVGGEKWVPLPEPWVPFSPRDGQASSRLPRKCGCLCSRDVRLPPKFGCLCLRDVRLPPKFGCLCLRDGQASLRRPPKCGCLCLYCVLLQNVDVCVSSNGAALVAFNVPKNGCLRSCGCPRSRAARSG
jgi:hypothetical protein